MFNVLDEFVVQWVTHDEPRKTVTETILAPNLMAAWQIAVNRARREGDHRVVAVQPKLKGDWF